MTIMTHFKKSACLSAIATMLFCVSSCGSDDSPRTALNDIEGEYSGDRAIVTVNGSPASDPRTTLKLPASGTSSAAVVFDGDIFLQSQALGYYEVNNDRSLGYQRPMISVTGRGTSDGATISGTYKAPDGNEVSIEGRLESTSFSSSHRLVMEIDHKLTDVPFIGKSYEIEFNSNDLFCNTGFLPGENYTCADGTEMNAREVLDWFFREMISATVRNSGIDGARITFNPDMTLDVSFRYSGRHTYMPSEYNGKYRYYADKNTVYFIAPEAFVLESRKYAYIDGLSPNVYLWYNLGVSDASGSYRVTAADYKTNTDGSLSLSLVHGDDHLSFINGWLDVVTGENNENIRRFSFLRKHVYARDLEYMPVAIARPASL